MKPYDKLLAFFGTQIKLAKAVKLTQSAVSFWKKNGIPYKKVLILERKTKGFVTRHEMRPDLYPKDNK